MYQVDTCTLYRTHSMWIGYVWAYPRWWIKPLHVLHFVHNIIHDILCILHVGIPGIHQGSYCLQREFFWFSRPSHEGIGGEKHACTTCWLYNIALHWGTCINLSTVTTPPSSVGYVYSWLLLRVRVHVIVTGKMLTVRIYMYWLYIAIL